MTSSKDINNTQKTDLHTALRARSSLVLRLSKLKRSGNGYRTPSPIAKVSVFADEIDRVEKSYKKMLNAIDNAVVKIEI